MSEDWGAYLRNMRLERERYEAEEGNTDKHETEILIPGRLALEGEVVSPAQKMANKLDKAGWEYKIGYSQARKEGDVYKTGPRAGEKRDDKIIDQCWIQAIHRERRRMFTATWVTDAGKTKLASILHDNRLIKSAELNALIDGQEGMS